MNCITDRYKTLCCQACLHGYHDLLKEMDEVCQCACHQVSACGLTAADKADYGEPTPGGTDTRGWCSPPLHRPAATP